MKDTLQNVSVRFHHRKPSKDPPPHSDSRPTSLEGPPPVFFPLPAPMTFLNPPGILFSLCTYAPDKRASLLLLQPAKHLSASGPWQARSPCLLHSSPRFLQGCLPHSLLGPGAYLNFSLHPGSLRQHSFFSIAVITTQKILCLPSAFPR